MNNTIYKKAFSGESLSFDDRLELVKWIVSEKVQEILLKELVIAMTSSQKKVDITLWAHVCRDSDENIRKFLWAMDAKDIKVSSDFPCGRAGENYEGRTFIKFSVR